MPNISYCGQLVQEQDRDRFLLSLFAPPQAREDLWALFAFNHEIAKTREVVTETQLGLIRLQWWREAIAKIYEGGAVPEHEVLTALAKAIKTHNLPRDYFETLIYAREFDLEDVQPSNLEGLLNYADFTTTPLLKLAVKITGDDPELEPVQPIAVNYALTGILRAVPFHAGQRRCLLPEDLLKKHGVNVYGLYDRKKQDGLSALAREVGEQIVPGVAPHNRFLRATQALSKMYTGRLKSLKYDVLNPRVQVPPLKELRLALKVAA